jgi:very-short-patch-repair endonuclease
LSLVRGSLFGVNALDVSVAQMAARQHSLIHRDQARSLGMTLRQYQARTKSGLYIRTQPNVARLLGSTVTREQVLLAACLSAGEGTVASHRAAALLWGLRGIEQAPVEVTVRPGRNPTLHDVVVHRSAVAEREVTARRGVPVTRPTATLVALGAVVGAAALESAVEDAILRRLTTVERLVAVVEQVGGPGRTGRAALRRVLAERGPGAAATESVLEDQMVQLLRAAGIDDFERQYWVGGYRLDFASPSRKLGVEVNGVAFHSGAVDVQRNCRKLNRLLAMGWRVLQFTWTDVRDRGHDVLGELSSAMAA